MNDQMYSKNYYQIAQKSIRRKSLLYNSPPDVEPNAATRLFASQTGRSSIMTTHIFRMGYEQDSAEHKTYQKVSISQNSLCETRKRRILIENPSIFFNYIVCATRKTKATREIDI